MPATIVPTYLPADQSQLTNLRTLFASPGYLLLKEVLTAHCIKEQVGCVNADLYSCQNDVAKDTADTHRKNAWILNRVIDTIEDIEAKESEWYTIKLEHRR